MTLVLGMAGWTAARAGDSGMRGQSALPASGAQANERLAASPRRAEWAVIRSGQDSVRAWVVYPARVENAPVNTFEELRSAIRARQPGDVVRLVYLRDGRGHVTSAMLERSHE